MKDALLTLADIAFSPPGAATTLSGLDLTIGRGEFLAVLGADGAARDALALLVAGVVKPERGEIRHQDQLSVGLVFPSPGQGLIAATVYEEVSIGLEWQGLSGAAVAARVRPLLQRFALWDQRHQSPSTLSGGEKQRLAIAASLALEPSCLVLNEPVAMLDPGSARSVAAAARAAAANGRAVLWLSGDAMQALIADRVAVMHGGRIVWQGRPPDLAQQGDKLDAWGLRPLPLAALTESLVRHGLSLAGKATTPEALVEEICSSWRTSTSSTMAASPPPGGS
ncbi:MAG: ATP-binding cassette domain-containing protein [Bacteroidota bacterium]